MTAFICLAIKTKFSPHTVTAWLNIMFSVQQNSDDDDDDIEEGPVRTVPPPPPPP